MLEELDLRNVGSIAEATVELGAGLNVLTGETGAGKTMVLTALNLLTGGKADPRLSSLGDTQVQGVWILDGLDAAARAHVAQAVDEAGGGIDDSGLIVMRQIRSGRSRGFAGGVAVPQDVLSRIAEQLVAIHGQSDQVRLRRSGEQRDVLDRFAGPDVAALKQAYSQAYLEVRARDEDAATARTRRGEYETELDALREGLELMEQVAPQLGEDDALDSRVRRLGNASELAAGVQEALASLRPDDDAIVDHSVMGGIGQARRALERLADLDPDSLEPLVSRIVDLEVLASELGADLSSYSADIDADPGELAIVQERIAMLSDLKRRYGPQLADAIEWSRKAAGRVYELEKLLDTDAVERARVQARQQLAVVARQLHHARSAAAQGLVDAVNAELAGLGMGVARFGVNVDYLPTSATTDPLTIDASGDDPASASGSSSDSESSRQVGFGASGADRVAFTLALHEGAGAGPLATSASGGELSRIMLALELVVSRQHTVSTFVFDEVDAGVGGAAAIEIGRRLARLGQQAQVIVVTHLPQVAAYADHHFHIAKDAADGVVRSRVTRLPRDERVRELARMLGGLGESELAQAHAQELVDTAAQHRHEDSP